MVALFPQVSCSLPAATAAQQQQFWKHPCLCSPVQLAGALPQELGHWFCSQKIWLSFEILFGCDCQMTYRGSNLDSNLNSAYKYLNKLCGVWILFKFRSDVRISEFIPTLIPQIQCSRYYPKGYGNVRAQYCHTCYATVSKTKNGPNSLLRLVLNSLLVSDHKPGKHT